MPYQVNKVDVWAGDIPNQPGTLAGVLEELHQAGANMEFMIARKLDENTSRIFIAPVTGAKVQKAASAAGFRKAQGLYSMRVEGPDKVGMGAKLTRAVADAGVNLRGASAAGLGKTAVFYLAVESEADLKNAMKVGKDALNSKPASKGKKTSLRGGNKNASAKGKTSGRTMKTSGMSGAKRGGNVALSR